jgi:hypothetical protein
MPPLLLPQNGRYGLRDHEKMFCPDLEADKDIFDLRGVDRQGCVVIVRPDQYVAHVLPRHRQLNRPRTICWRWRGMKQARDPSIVGIAFPPE